MPVPAGHLSPQDTTGGGARYMKSLTCSSLFMTFEWQQSVQKDHSKLKLPKSQVKTRPAKGLEGSFQELGPTGLEKRQQI